MTSTQSIFNKNKRKQKDTWRDIETLNQVLRNGKYPRGDDILGPGSGSFRHCVIASILALHGMRQRTRQNAKDWNFYDECIQRLIQIATGIQTR